MVDRTKCPNNGQLVTFLRTASEVAGGPLSPGTQLAMQCQICPDVTAGAPVNTGCEY